jgi:hypothetical protein
VAPNGALYTADTDVTVRRVSAPKWPVSGGPPAERTVTTLIGSDGPGVQFARSSAECFRTELAGPWATALHVSATASAVDPDLDAGRLYVSCDDGVHVFDLAQGHRARFSLSLPSSITGLAVTDDDTRLFVVAGSVVGVINTRTGAVTELLPERDPARPKAPRALGHGMGCVIDSATRSLVICDYNAYRIVRLRGIDV